MARRIVAIVAVVPAVTLAPLPCPFVHRVVGSGRVRCQHCRSKISGRAIRAFHDDCNGDVRCTLGEHVPRLCDVCVAAPDHDTRDQEAI